MGRQFWYWMGAMLLLVGALWFVWQVEFAGSRQSHTKADASAMPQQSVLVDHAQRLVRQGQQHPEKAKKEGRALANKVRSEADFIIHDATFYGRSSANKNWRIDAAKAVQQKGEASVYLQALDASVKNKEQAYVALQANTGRLHEKRGLLVMEDGFKGTVYGHTTKGKAATYQLKKQQAEGRELKVLGDTLNLEAARFKAYLEKGKASFDGGVHVQTKLHKE